MAKYKASYQLGTKSTTSEARKRKEQRRWKEEKRKLTACENRRKRECLIFRSLGGVSPCRGLWAGHIWYSPLDSWLWNPTFICLPQRHTKHACARPLQGKLLRPGRPGDCLGLLHLRVNLRLSYRTASKYKMVCLGQVMFLLEFGLVMDTKTIDISWHKSILLKATSGNMSKMWWDFFYINFTFSKIIFLFYNACRIVLTI